MSLNRLGFLVLSLFALALTTGCTKQSGCKPVPVGEEESAILAFNQSIGMNATRHPSGIYYEILAPGSINKPGVSNRVYVRYVGKTFDGQIFDQQTNPAVTGWVLSTLIEGWRFGIPLIGKGGRILLTIPSSLGYGCQGGGEKIPPNSPLFFEIELVDWF